MARCSICFNRNLQEVVKNPGVFSLLDTFFHGRGSFKEVWNGLCFLINRI